MSSEQIDRYLGRVTITPYVPQGSIPEPEPEGEDFIAEPIDEKSPPLVHPSKYSGYSTMLTFLGVPDEKQKNVLDHINRNASECDYYQYVLRTSKGLKVVPESEYTHSDYVVSIPSDSNTFCFNQVFNRPCCLFNLFESQKRLQLPKKEIRVGLCQKIIQSPYGKGDFRSEPCGFPGLYVKSYDGFLCNDHLK